MRRIERPPLTRRGFLVAGGLGLTAAAMDGAAGPPEEGVQAPRSQVVQGAEGQKTYLLVFDKGAEVMAGLLRFATQHRLVGGSLTGIGAVSDATLAFFDRQKKE